MDIEKNLLIDHILRFEKNRAIVCRSLVPKDAPIFSNHFPGKPILPGIILIEAMAQASGYLCMISTDFASMLYLATIRQAKFKSFVVPGDELEIIATLKQVGDKYVAYECKIHTLDKRNICTSELILSSQDFYDPKLKETFRKNVLELVKTV